MRKNLFVIFSILIIIIILTFSCCNATYSTDNDKGTALDTTKVVFVLDGKQVTYHTINVKSEKGELNCTAGTAKSKEAIQWFGEKFRYGAVFLSQKTKTIFFN